MSEDGKSMPDVGKLVELIMKNPQLIEQISNLANADNDSNGEVGGNQISEDVIIESEQKSESETASYNIESDAKKRSRLLYALKPYLSERRAKALDSVMTFGEIFDAMKSKR